MKKEEIKKIVKNYISGQDGCPDSYKYSFSLVKEEDGEEFLNMGNLSGVSPSYDAEAQWVGYARWDYEHESGSEAIDRIAGEIADALEKK